MRLSRIVCDRNYQLSHNRRLTNRRSQRRLARSVPLSRLPEHSSSYFLRPRLQIPAAEIAVATDPLHRRIEELDATRYLQGDAIPVGQHFQFGRLDAAGVTS